MKMLFHEKRKVGLLLTFLGGVMDGYTYIHYDVFASAQTGNIVLGVIQGSNGEWGSVLKKALSTLFFFCGIVLTKYFIDFFNEKKIYHWRLYILFYEAFIFFIVGLKGVNSHPALVTVLISFSASMQWVAFDKINGMAYTNLFTTGNLKGMTTNFYDSFIAHKKGAKERFYHYLWVVLSFVSGAISVVALYHLVERKAIYLAAILFLYLGLSETYLVWKFYREELGNLKRNKEKL